MDRRPRPGRPLRDLREQRPRRAPRRGRPLRRRGGRIRRGGERMSDTLTRGSYEPSGPYGLFVGGEETAGDAEFAALDPSTGEQWATVAEASTDQVDFAVGAAVKAFRGWRRSTLEERQRIPLKLADAIA